MNLSAKKKIVEKILADVRRRGDAALAEYTRRLDRVNLKPKDFLIRPAEFREAAGTLSPRIKRALEEAKRNITSFQKRLLPRSWKEERRGLVLGEVYAPVERAGIYVPGGRFSYPSSVLMSALPARVAGVREIIMVTPPGNVSPALLYAARISGVSRVFRVGGAQAIAALAYGTRTIPKVDKIAGPGNLYVTLAKQMVFGEVGIDMLAGPSEVMVFADESAPAGFVLRDLSAQAEHDPLSRAVLLSTSKRLLSLVRGKAPKNKQFRSIRVKSREEAVKIINRSAPEHLELLVKDPYGLLKDIRNAGAVFVGPYTPVALGDYWAGPSHVLPTGGSARFTSGLSSLSFLKRISIIQCKRGRMVKDAGSIVALAEAEGMEKHAESVSIRVEED